MKRFDITQVQEKYSLIDWIFLGEWRMSGKTKACASGLIIRGFKGVCTQCPFSSNCLWKIICGRRRLVQTNVLFQKSVHPNVLFHPNLIKCFMAEDECSIRPKCVLRGRLFRVSKECSPQCPFSSNLFAKKIFDVLSINMENTWYWSSVSFAFVWN